jgi:hypothetical protein
MWAQLQVEQGSTKTKHTLEVEYRALQPNDRQEWERQVRSFINNNNNNSDSGSHPAAELRSEMKALDACGPSRGRKRNALDAGLLSRPAQESEKVDRDSTKDESITMKYWYLPEVEQSIWKFEQAH